MSQPLLTLENAKQYFPKVIVQAFTAPYRAAVGMNGQLLTSPHRLVVEQEEAGFTHTSTPVSEGEFKTNYRRIGDSDSQFYDISMPPVLIAPLAQFPSVVLDVEPVVHFQFTNTCHFVYLGNHRLMIVLDSNPQTISERIRTAHLAYASVIQDVLMFDVLEYPVSVTFRQATNDAVTILDTLVTRDSTYPHTTRWQMTIKAMTQTNPSEERFVVQQPDGQLSIINRFQVDRTFVPVIV